MLSLKINLELSIYKISATIFRFEIKVYIYNKQKKKVKAAHSTEKNDSFNISITCAKFLGMYI